MNKCMEFALCFVLYVLHLKGSHASHLTMAEGPEVGRSSAGTMVGPFLKMTAEGKADSSY